MTFRDHHHFTPADLDRIVSAATGARSSIVLTTEKDAVRLAALNLKGTPIAALPLVVGVEPADRFQAWLLERLNTSRASRAAIPRTA
jgi:tetraacyldisaccharide 4'-kinase